MESKRQQKFSRLIQKELSEIFQRDTNTLLPNSMITITKVRASPDLGTVRVFLSFFNTDDHTLAINTINAHNSEIRYNLGKRIKDQVRGIPQLDFFIDDTNEYVDRIDKIFNRINKDLGGV
ncbi:MAG: 30S ribosome-binding factor RbfA [Sphingobacteriales bacterium]|nr:MAG: 30S ribosome-binding factor RbfA [Sphingobacteriales bacterium]TAF81897.1 MAG: 30S ribosome-binding factor RbfA [Sphingobacteriales bacterium]